MASFEKMKNGTWSVRYREYVDGQTLQRRMSGFKTKREAEVAYHQIAVTIETKPSQGRTKKQPSLTELFDEYFVFAQNRVKESTLYDLQKNYTLHIAPFFARFETVSKIKKIDILRWQDYISQKGFSYNYKCKLRTVLSSVWKFGMRYHDIEHDPISSVESFRRTEAKKEMQVWNENDFAQFIDCVDDEMYKTFFTFLYSTGCRKGEVYALKWQNIDLDRQTARIEKTILRRFDRAKHPDKLWLEAPPKNIYSVRTIDLPKSLVAMLSVYKWLESPASTDFVFGCKNPLADTNVQRVFTKAISQSGVKTIRIHDLRHSHASYLISKGLDVVAVAKRLGHANTHETLNTYAHFFAKDREKIRAVLDEM